MKTKEIFNITLTIIGVAFTVYLAFKPEKIEYITKVEQFYMESKESIKETINSPVLELAIKKEAPVVKEVVKEVIKEVPKEVVKTPVEIKPVVKATTTESIVTQATSTVKEEVKLNPFEVVSWDFRFENSSESYPWEFGPGNTVNVKHVYVKPLQRQGTLANISGCERYIKSETKNKVYEQDFVTIENNNGYLKIKTVTNDTYKLKTMIKCTAIYNTGKETLTYTSDWTEVR